MAKTLPNGQIQVEAGDTLSGIYGANWKALSGYTGDPKKLPIGTVLPSPKSNTTLIAGKTDPNQPYPDADYENKLASHPKIAESVSIGNTVADIENAAATGNFSGIKNQYGQPFSVEEQTAALAEAEKDNAAYYDSLKQKEKADAESTLAQKQADYQDYLISSGEKFAADKTTLDQRASDTGMLFSTARNQKEQKLQTAYQREGASKLADVGRSIADTAREYQYKYGNEGASGLSQFYNLGSNQYNPNVATGGVSSGGLSSIYNPSQYSFNGTRLGERAGAANTRAARMLANKGNKLLATGYNNQL